jgi:hypothetical protein
MQAPTRYFELLDEVIAAIESERHNHFVLQRSEPIRVGSGHVLRSRQRSDTETRKHALLSEAL